MVNLVTILANKIINIKKLVILDLALHGKRFILIEFIGGAILSLIFAVLFNNSQNAVVAFLFLGLGINYLSLAIHAILISSQKKLAVDPKLLEYESRKTYTTQSLLVLLPFVLSIIALYQQLKNGK